MAKFIDSIQSDALLKKYDIDIKKIADGNVLERTKLKKVFDVNKTLANLSTKHGKVLENQRLGLVVSSPERYKIESITKPYINKSAKTKAEVTPITATATAVPKLPIQTTLPKVEGDAEDNEDTPLSEVIASAAVKEYATEKEIDIKLVKGSGKDGRISKGASDVPRSN